MDNLNINEKVNTTDTSSMNFSGVITLYEDGKVILKAHNLILKNGRKLLYGTSTGGSQFNINNLVLKIGYDANRTSVSETDTITDYTGFTSSDNGISYSKDNEPTTDTDALTVTYVYKISNANDNSDNNKFNWVGLATADAETLFSRSLFNTVIVPPSRTIKLSYTIYF